MEYIAEQRLESDFAPVVSPCNIYLVTWNSVSFYDNKAFDFSFFGSLSFLNIPKFDFYSTAFSTYNFYTNAQTRANTGLYTWSLSQNP